MPAQSALARYNANGSPDTTFGSGGTVAVTAIGGITALNSAVDAPLSAKIWPSSARPARCNPR